MSKKLRPTPAGVIACLALAVSLGGTAFAAAVLVPKNSVGSPQVINGSLQKTDLSRRAIAALRGRRGVQGIQGDPGEIGPLGPTGAPGPKGAPGDPWSTNGTLPSGRTLRGVFGPGGTALDVDELAQETISFGFGLANGAVVHYIDVGATPPPECPGTPGSPQAQAGHLCIYAARIENVNTNEVCVFNPVTNNCGEASGRGFGVAIRSALDGDFWLQGSWAVTAA